MLILFETIIKIISCIKSDIIANIGMSWSILFFNHSVGTHYRTVVLYGNTTTCVASTNDDEATINLGLADW